MSDIGGIGGGEPNIAMGSFGQSGGRTWATGKLQVQTDFKEWVKGFKDATKAVTEFLKPWGELDSKVLPKVDKFFQSVFSHLDSVEKRAGRAGGALANMFQGSPGQTGQGVFTLGRTNQQFWGESQNQSFASLRNLISSTTAQAKTALNSPMAGYGLGAANIGVGMFQRMNMGDFTNFDLSANQLTRSMPGGYSQAQNFALQNNLSKGVMGWQNLGELGAGALTLNQMVPFAGGAGTPTFGQLAKGAGGISVLNPQLGYVGAAQALGTMASPQVLQNVARFGPTAGLIAPGGGVRDVSQALRTFGEIGYAGNPNAGLQPMSQINKNSVQARNNLSQLGLDPQTIEAIMSYMQASSKAGKFIDVTNKNDLAKAGVDKSLFYSQTATTEAKSRAELKAYQGGEDTLLTTNTILQKTYDFLAGSGLAGVFGKVMAPLAQVAQLLGLMKLGGMLGHGGGGLPGGLPIPGLPGKGGKGGGGTGGGISAITGGRSILGRVGGGAAIYAGTQVAKNQMGGGWQQGAATIAGETAAGATAGSFIPVFGTAVGGMLGAAHGITEAYGGDSLNTQIANQLTRNPGELAQVQAAASKGDKRAQALLSAAGLGDPPGDVNSRIPDSKTHAGNVSMDPRLLSAMKKMFMDNPRLVLNSGVRDSAVQAQLYAKYLAGKGPVAAKPGTSQHEKGEAIDVGPSSEYGWLASNAGKYGLVKTVPSEPWHFELTGNRTQSQIASARGADKEGASGGSGGASTASGNNSPLNTVADFLQMMGGPAMPTALGSGGGVGTSSQSNQTQQGGGTVSAAGGSQLDIARTILAVGKSSGASSQAILAAIETGLVESGLSNVNHGDRDSLGVFQQRPSQGWGTAAQIMNVSYAAGQFFKHAAGINAATAGDLAADVQRPAAQYRGRYGQNRNQAVSVLNQIGYDASGIAGDPPSMHRGGNIRAAAVSHSVVVQRLELNIKIDKVSDAEATRLAKMIIDKLHNSESISQFASE